MTQAAVSANDVNLFLLVVLDDEPNDIRLQLKRVKPKVNFMKKEDIKPGLEVYPIWNCICSSAVATSNRASVTEHSVNASDN